MSTTFHTARPAPPAARSPRDVTTRRVVMLGLLVAALALAAFGGLANKAFVTPDNGLAILRAAALTGIAAMGATFITLSGRFFSLALGQSAVFAGVTFSVLMAHGVPLGLALAVTVIAAIIVGAIQGVIIAMGANPIITTLGAGALLAGLAGLTTGGKNVRIESGAVEWIGNARPLGVPTQTWAFALIVGAAWWVVNRTRFGRETILMGANRATASGSGIPVWRVTVIVFVLAGITAAVVGVFGAAQFSQARTSEFSTLDFDVVAAVLIGGTAIQGGQGSPVRSALGAVLIATIQNYMLLLGWSSGVRTVITGAFIVVIVVGFHLVRRSRGV